MNQSGEVNGNGNTPISSESIARLQAARQRITAQLGKVIVGQQDVIDQLLICIFSRGHCLL